MITLLNRFSKDKIFAVGFDECGAAMLHRFLVRNHIRSALWKGRAGYLATQISHNLAKGRPVLGGLDDYAAFLDLFFFSNDAWIEANGYFRQLHEQHPDAYFILNDRPAESWIKARGADPRLVEMAARFFAVDAASVASLWRQRYDSHRQAVLAYAPHIKRFLHFDVDSDPPQRLAEFLKDSFQLSPAAAFSRDR